MSVAAEKGHPGPPSSSSLPSVLCFFFGALLIASRNLAKFSGVMQPSNLHGASDRLDDCIEELRWENGQLFAAHPIESTERDKWIAPSPSYSLSDLTLQSTDKEHPLKLADLEDEKIEEATAFATTDELTDLLDDLGSRNSVCMTRDTSLPSLPRSPSYSPATEMKRCDPLPQHMPSLSGNLEDLARLCGPSLQSGHLGVDARCRSVVPTLPFNLPRNDLSKFSDAVLNRISAKCMGSSLQSLENTLLNQSARDPLILNAAHINPVGNLLSSSNAASRSSVDISPSSDLESVLLDSSGSGFNPGNGGKAGDIAGGKKARAVDDLDSDSEGSFDEILAPRKPRQEQGPSSKRMRAAEIHNEAERKRRGRINEKLKALQELIPNANKTDKASVLSEAIEYLKKLRLQLQMMCCRNGLVISPFPDSQQVQNPQMQHAGACLNMDGESPAARGQNSAPLGVQRFPATNTAAQECSVPTNVPPFNDSAFPATTAFVSTSKGIGHDRYQF